MEIRIYRETDESAVIALWREVLPDSAPHNDPASSIQRKSAFDRNLFFVATVDYELAGAVMGGYDGHRGWVYSLAVKPERRGQGIGTALARHLEQALAELDCRKVNLQVLLANEGVIDFYRKLGFAVEERISMGKRLYGDG